MHNRSVGMIKIYLNFGLNRIMFLFFQANFLFLPVLGILLEKDIFHATQGTSTFSRTLRIESIRGNCQNRKSTQKIITKQRTQCLPLQNTGRYYAMRKLVTNCWANRIQSTGLTVQHKIYTDPNIHTGRSTRNTCHYRVFVLVAFFIGFLFVWKSHQTYDYTIYLPRCRMLNSSSRYISALVDRIWITSGLFFKFWFLRIILLDLELFMRLAGVKNFWGRDKGICRAWLAADPYIYLTEASKVEVTIHQSWFDDVQNRIISIKT